MAGRPNILFVMDDQHRFDWLGSAGADWVYTPNLDRLASRGLQFDSFFTNAPLCVPARIALATGLLPTRTGMVDNQSWLPGSLTTYYQRLRDAGYVVGCVGKLHMNHKADPQVPDGAAPRCYTWGFTHPEEHEGKCEAGLVAGPTGIYTTMLADRGRLGDFVEDYRQRQRIGWHRACADSVLPTELFQDYWTGSRAVDWLQQVRSDQPWHLFVSFGGPHDPFDPPLEFAETYRDADMPEPIHDDLAGKPALQHHHRDVRPYFPGNTPRATLRSAGIDRDATAGRAPESPETVRECRRQYAACIAVVDDRVGALLQVLEDRGMADDTVVIFTSDHGEMIGDHGLWRKRLMYEPAIHVPLLMAGPGVPTGERTSALVELMDLNPTICSLAGLPDLGNRSDALSFAPLLSGAATEHRDAVVSYLWPYMSCVRTYDHKLVQTTNDRFELYDLHADPTELHNLIDQEPELAETLGAQLATRQRAWQAPGL
jgi:arylsulfatase